MKKNYLFLLIIPLVFLGYTVFTQASSLAESLKGRILLQVEENGEAWYISPENLKRYFLGRPDDAFSVMREQGVGISNSNLAKIPVSLDYLSGPDTSGDGLPDDFKIALGLNVNSTDSDGDGYSDYEELLHGFDPLGPGRLNHDLNFARSQAGRILLQVEQNGEAWYVSPENNKRYFLGRPADAFSIMRNLGLGISNDNLDKIEVEDNENNKINNNQENYFEILYENSNNLSTPTIYNNTLVWLEHDGQVNHVYYMNIENKKPIKVSNTERNLSPMVYDNNIVYISLLDGKCIFLFNIGDYSTIEIANNFKDCRSPYINGDNIVWTSYVGGIELGYGLEQGLWTIHVYNIKNQEITNSVETSVEAKSFSPKPIIFENRIVWLERNYYGASVYMFDLNTNQKTKITQNNINPINPYIYDNRIIYMDKRNNKPNNAFDIYMYDLISKEEKRITDNNAEPIDKVLNNYGVFWSDKRNGHRNHDIYSYSFITNEEKIIAKSSNFYELSPFVHQNKIVYIKKHTSSLEDNRIILEKF